MADYFENESSGEGFIISWVPKLIDSQVDLIANNFAAFISLLFSLPNANLNPNPNTNPTPSPSPGFPEIGAHHLLRRLGHGIIGAVYAGMVLTLVMAAAAILGMLAVNYWVEEPMVAREKLHFDFTEFNPQATFVFGGVWGERKRKQQQAGVPVGHTLHVSVELLVPDSDYNRDIGVFQIMAEVISTSGKTIARSSQPSMLHYRSYLIRLMHTLFMGLPLILGLSHETQRITVEMLNYKEDHLMRTEAIKIVLIPRAGTAYLPQLYEAEIIMHSRLPRVKELIHNWKWTFYVWTSVHIYVMLLLLILCFFRPLLVFPALKGLDFGEDHHMEGGISVEREEKPGLRVPEEREFTETLRKWQQYRRKRKAELLSWSSTFMEEDRSLTSASSYTVAKEDMGPGIEDVTDSESVCFGS